MQKNPYTRRLKRIVVFVEVFVVLVAALACDNASPGPTSPTPSKEKGAALYTKYCLSCHGGSTGGQISDIPPPHNTNGHTWHHPDQQLTDIILSGLNTSTETQKMPAFRDKLAVEDTLAILAYIKTWWSEEQRAFQATATKQQSDYQSGK